MINNINIDFRGTKATLTCSPSGFRLISHYSEIRDDAVWDIDAQGHGAAYLSIESLKDAMLILPHIKEVLNLDITINVKTMECSDSIRKNITIFINEKPITRYQMYTDKDNVPFERFINMEKEICNNLSAIVYGIFLGKDLYGN